MSSSLNISSSTSSSFSSSSFLVDDSSSRSSSSRNSSKNEKIENPKESIEFIQYLNKLCTKIYNITLEIIYSEQFKTQHHIDFIKYKFISEKKLETLNFDCFKLAKKINHYVKWRLKDTGFVNEEVLFTKHDITTIPHEYLEILPNEVSKLKDLSMNCWKKNVDTHQRVTIRRFPNILTFVKKFNNNYQSRTKYRKAAFIILDNLRNLTLHKSHKDHIDVSQIPSIRMGYFEMYQCQDPSIKEQSLIYLTELLECDPLEMDTAYDLVNLQKGLLEHIKANKAQNLNTKLQRLLIKCYAVTLESILIHAAAQHLNALTEETKKAIWDGADELSEFNVVNDEEIKFWTDYAVQGAQHIKTNEKALNKWLVRLALIARAGFQLAAAFIAPEEAHGTLTGAMNDLKTAFSNIQRKKQWFETLLFIKRLARHSMTNVQAFQTIIPVIQNQKRVNNKPKLFYGIVSTLEFCALHSPVSEIQEESIKLLLQYLSIDNPLIQCRITHAFAQMQLSDNKKLSNTAFMLMRLLNAAKHFRSEEVRTLVKKQSEISTITQKENKAKTKKISKSCLYPNAIHFLLRRIAEIKDEQDFGGHSLVTLLASSNEKIIVPSLLKCMSNFSKDFLEPDVYGNSPYHIAVKQKNLSIIKQLSESHININLNAYNCEQKTALHQGIENNFLEAVYLLINLRADLNVQNKQGNTPLHLAVSSNNAALVKQLIEKKAKLNIQNFKGETALNVAINNDLVYIVELLIQNNAKIAESIHQITPISMAAVKKAKRSLIFLISNAKYKLSTIEGLEIMRMITKDGKTISCPEFCWFHTRALKTNKHYAKSFIPFTNFGTIEEKKNNKYILVRRKKSTFLFNSIKGDIHNNKLIKTDKKLDSFGNTPLIKFARTPEYYNDFVVLAKKTKDINKTNYLDLTPLHVAILFKNIKAVELLLKLGANPDLIDIRGFSALHFAAYMKNNSLIKLLLQNGADPNKKNVYGDTPLLVYCQSLKIRKPKSLLSIKSKHIKKPKIGKVRSSLVVKSLLNQKASPTVQDRMGNNALHHAVKYRNIELIKYFITHFSKLAWKRNNKGTLPIQEILEKLKSNEIVTLISKSNLLHWHEKLLEKTKNKTTLGNLLAQKNHHKLFHSLVQSEPNIASHQDSDHWRLTPLHVAAENGNKDILKIYNNLNLPLDVRDRYGNTALHLAALREQTEFIRELLKTKLKIGLKNQDGRTALHFAASRQSIENIELLIQQSQLSKQKDGHGNLPLHIASKYGFTPIVKVLSKTLKSVTQLINDDGNNPLHIACIQGHLNIVKYLIENNMASLETKNTFGLTPLLLAVQQGHKGIVKYLIKKGANIREQDDEGETTLHKAVFHHHDELVEILLQTDNKQIKTKERSLVNITDIRQEPPLHELIKKDFDPITKTTKLTKILNQLIDGGSDLKAQNEIGETFLHHVCFDGDSSLLFLLFDRAKRNKKLIDFTAIDNRGNTLLHKAAEGDQLSVTQTLIAHKLNPNKKNTNGETPAMIAASKGYHRIVNHYLNYKASIKHIDNEGRGLLHIIFSKSTLTDDEIDVMIKIIKKCPKLIYLKDNKGHTPIHIIAQYNHKKALVPILEHLQGNEKKQVSYIYTKSNDNLTAYEIAKQNKHENLAKLILTFPKNKIGIALKK